MSEITDMTDNEDGIELSPTARKFIVHWGELGSRWGINRSVAQIHALLYLSQKPLDVMSIAETLEIARSNASMGLKELRGWGLVKVLHILGDRREHFEAIGDVWQILAIVTEQRKRREIDPMLAMLRECGAETRSGGSVAERFSAKRIGEMLQLFESVSPLLDEFLALPPAAIKTVAGFRGRVRSLFRIK